MVNFRQQIHSLKNRLFVNGNIVWECTRFRKVLNCPFKLETENESDIIRMRRGSHRNYCAQVQTESKRNNLQKKLLKSSVERPGATDFEKKTDLSLFMGRTFRVLNPKIYSSFCI